MQLLQISTYSKNAEGKTYMTSNLKKIGTRKMSVFISFTCSKAALRSPRKDYLCALYLECYNCVFMQMTYYNFSLVVLLMNNHI